MALLDPHLLLKLKIYSFEAIDFTFSFAFSVIAASFIRFLFRIYHFSAQFFKGLRSHLELYVRFTIIIFLDKLQTVLTKWL